VRTAQSAQCSQCLCEDRGYEGPAGHIREESWCADIDQSGCMSRGTVDPHLDISVTL